MVNRYFDGIVPAATRQPEPFDSEILRLCAAAREKGQTYQFDKMIASALTMLSRHRPIREPNGALPADQTAREQTACRGDSILLPGCVATWCARTLASDAWQHVATAEEPGLPGRRLNAHLRHRTEAAEWLPHPGNPCIVSPFSGSGLDNSNAICISDPMRSTGRYRYCAQG